MTLRRYLNIKDVLGQSDDKTGLLLVELGLMTEEELRTYLKLSALVYNAHKDDKGKQRLLEELREG